MNKNTNLNSIVKQECRTLEMGYRINNLGNMCLKLYDKTGRKAEFLREIDGWTTKKCDEICNKAKDRREKKLDKLMEQRKERLDKLMEF